MAKYFLYNLDNLFFKCADSDAEKDFLMKFNTEGSAVVATDAQFERVKKGYDAYYNNEGTIDETKNDRNDPYILDENAERAAVLNDGVEMGKLDKADFSLQLEKYKNKLDEVLSHQTLPDQSTWQADLTALKSFDINSLSWTDNKITGKSFFEVLLDNGTITKSPRQLL